MSVSKVVCVHSSVVWFLIAFHAFRPRLEMCATFSEIHLKVPNPCLRRARVKTDVILPLPPLRDVHACVEAEERKKKKNSAE